MFSFKWMYSVYFYLVGIITGSQGLSILIRRRAIYVNQCEGIATEWIICKKYTYNSVESLYIKT